MANYNTLFALSVTLPTSNAAEELEDLLKLNDEEVFRERIESQCDDACPAVDAYRNDSTVLIESPEYGNPHVVLKTIHFVLKKHQIHDVVVRFSWADTCSSLRQDGFGGGYGWASSKQAMAFSTNQGEQIINALASLKDLLEDLEDTEGDVNPETGSTWATHGEARKALSEIHFQLNSHNTNQYERN